MAKKLIVGNWKMHPATLADAKKLFDAVKRKVTGVRNAEVAIAPPALFLGVLTERYKGKTIAFCGQDAFFEQEGAYTGEVSPEQLKSVGVRYCIIGHSERRALGEGDETVNRKLRSVMARGLTPILCVGESERDDDGAYLSFVSAQIRRGLVDVPLAEVKNIIIAYEPVWAIGKSAESAMKPRDMHEMKLYIYKLLVERYGESVAKRVRILYGGSVEGSNASAILTESAVDGFLVGHASLSAESFAQIARSISKTR
ncbi:triose-phosphate isomerase [Candidatus Kaiserbacteria bacterium CG10_big_fil_rev_8_21_14_0_10_49_17]|uniref:Triosephosphate isomerase n=1 Tax=Candidatus Kaiserbacteria bacterium CG10_big_fil_rev_8_21_14_0_10_49_17 TaxID=1974609 RepID=A0A2M6WEJ8_9BACT|nr:MAG: triose-phosphate isomerase [Candidatus Kaiserbacteria bacterium CG10_big_fil_rev_8_21_14_0_10_49_17]